MGDYERVIADAQACLSWAGAKNAPAFQYRIFCALTALGEYEKATDLFRQIISPGYDARSKFQNWCMKYVFDTLEAGRSWHPAGREPVGPAFLPMVEAEETYRPRAGEWSLIASPAVGRRTGRSWRSVWGTSVTAAWRSSIPPPRKPIC
jgi:hypothetical protein